MREYLFHVDGSTPRRGEIFVFGSNWRGIHGKGAAEAARRLYGAAHGVGIGRTGNAYAIPTKKTPWQNLPLDEIAIGVQLFKKYAADNPNLTFLVTRIGCGERGLSNADVAPLFIGSPSNCSFAADWRPFVGTPPE